jgi:predicted small metal-binding protein
MKKMTCKELGGSCDTAIEGNSAEEMMENAAKHVTEMSEKDEGHRQDKAMMDKTQQAPEVSKKWFEEFKLKFNSLPES